MAEIKEEEESIWKNKIAAVAAKDLRGVFAILYLPEKKTLAVIPDPDMILEAKGVEVLLRAYLPPEIFIILWPSEPKTQYLGDMEKGELIYTYSRQAYQGRLEILRAEAKPARRGLLRSVPDPRSSLFGKLVLASLIQAGVLLFIMVFAGAQEASLLNPRTLVTWIGGVMIVAMPFNFVLIKFGALLGGFFMKIMGESTGPAERGYSRELALAGRGEREEAIAQLEDRFSGSQDPQALREALRVTLKNPPMKEDGRRLIQEMLKLKSIPADEKVRLKEDLALLG